VQENTFIKAKQHVEKDAEMMDSCDADESPYDTESKTKIIKRFKELETSDMDAELHFVSKSIFQDDSDLESMPEDEIEKVDQLESNITKIVSKEIQNSVPTLIAEGLKQNLPSLLSKTLKNSLQELLKETVATSIDEKPPVFDHQIQQTLKSQFPDLIIKPMNREFNAFNELEANRFVMLQQALSKDIHT
nr:hypothetical protein [Tanacetum cinerariifolium]